MSELTHYGVLGMHWGVRKDGKPQGFQYAKQPGVKYDRDRDAYYKEEQDPLFKDQTRRQYDLRDDMQKNADISSYVADRDRRQEYQNRIDQHKANKENRRALEAYSEAELKRILDLDNDDINDMNVDNSSTYLSNIDSDSMYNYDLYQNILYPYGDYIIDDEY